MQPRREFLRIALVGSMASLLAACAPAAPAAPTSPPAPAAKPATLKEFRFGAFAPSALSAWNLMGVRKGFFQEEGLTPNVTEANSPDLLRALVAGRLDMTTISVGTGIAGIAEGAEIVMIGTINNIGDAMYAANGINKLSDVVGKRILTFTPGTTPHTTVLALLRRNNIAENQVQIQATGVGDRERVTALLAGETDFTVAGVEYTPTVESSGKAKVLGMVADELKGLVSTTLWVRADTLKQQPDFLVSGAKAVVRGVRYAYDNPSETVAYLKEILKSDDQALMEQTVKDFKRINRVDPNLALSPEMVTTLLDFFSKEAAGKVTPDKLATMDIRQKVIASMGTYTHKP
jgi:NitT/TauT family transport system substrate-binding protein